MHTAFTIFTHLLQIVLFYLLINEFFLDYSIFVVDCTRVILSEIAGIPGSDYINANYIRGASGSQAYIASQGPLVHTVTDFWRMVVECDVQVLKIFVFISFNVNKLPTLLFL